MSDSLRPHGLWPTRLLCPWNSLGKNTGVPFPSPGDLPDPGIEPGIHIAGGFFTIWATKPRLFLFLILSAHTWENLVLLPLPWESWEMVSVRLGPQNPLHILWRHSLAHSFIELIGGQLSTTSWSLLLGLWSPVQELRSIHHVPKLPPGSYCFLFPWDALEHIINSYSRGANQLHTFFRLGWFPQS